MSQSHLIRLYEEREWDDAAATFRPPRYRAVIDAPQGLMMAYLEELFFARLKEMCAAGQHAPAVAEALNSGVPLYQTIFAVEPPTLLRLMIYWWEEITYDEAADMLNMLQSIFEQMEGAGRDVSPRTRQWLTDFFTQMVAAKGG